MRFLPNGRLDRSFSRDGVAPIGLRYGQFPTAFALERDGRIVIAGMGARDSMPNIDYFEVARLRPNGRADRSFSGDGISIVDWHGRDDVAGGLAVRRDGKIVVVGSSD